MVVMLLANVLNFGLNYLLMFGPWEMGAAGAALGTSLARWFMFFALAGYVLLLMRGRDGYGVAAPMAGAWRLEWRLLRLGAPLSASYGLETAAFTAMATFAGWLGPVPLAAYQICLNLLALIYMLAIGIATATAVRVGNAVGRRDRPGLAVAGWVGAGLGVTVMLAITPLLYGFRGPIVALYNDSPEVAVIAVPGLVIGSLVLLFDAAQGILMGALRGAADVVAPTALQLVSFWGVIVPLGYLLGHGLGHGVRGLLWAMLVGFVLAALLMALRFKVLAAREVQPA
jgi:MATE family multidrug resistance protein